MLNPGDTIGELVLARRLGKGAFAEVWLARGESVRPVAVKILDPQFVDDTAGTGPTISERFIEEARLLRSVSAPGLVKVLDLIHDPEARHLAIVMEHVAGKPLCEMIGELGLDEVLELLADVADTLDVLHGAGVIHRDVKTDNILVGGNSERRWAKLIDLGLAKDVEAKSIMESTAGGIILGTLRAMAPECFSKLEGRDVVITPSADQWSLGIALVEAVNGAPAWEGLALFDLMQSIRSRPPDLVIDPRYQLTGVPAAVSTIVQVCLRQDPAHRFESMAELAEAMRAAASSCATPIAPLRALPPAADTVASQPPMPDLEGEAVTLRPGHELAVPFEDASSMGTEAGGTDVGLPMLPTGGDFSDTATLIRSKEPRTDPEPVHIPHVVQARASANPRDPASIAAIPAVVYDQDEAIRNEAVAPTLIGLPKVPLSEAPALHQQHAPPAARPPAIGPASGDDPTHVPSTMPPQSVPPQSAPPQRVPSIGIEPRPRGVPVAVFVAGVIVATVLAFAAGWILKG